VILTSEKSVSTSKLSPLFCLTIPRSGYHLLIKRMDFYFGDELQHVELTRYLPLGFPTSKLANHGISLNHDSGINRAWPWSQLYSFPKRDASKYMILFRNPLLSMISDFQLHERNGLKRGGSVGEWKHYAIKGIRYRKRFIRKWLVGYNGDNVLTLSYEQCAKDPKDCLRRAIKHAQRVEERLNEDRLQACLDRFPFDGHREYEDHKFYDKAFFEELRSRLEETAAYLEEHEEYGIDLSLP
jgi:hypothetical protein|tara:strand:+ start:362 stop:1084 length:723 start_codon:yes stop_codon:yes gene_type:complete